MTDAFPDDQWPELLRLMEADGPAAVVDFVQAHEDSLARRKLYLLAVGALGRRDWSKDMDALLFVANAGIDESLRQADAESDPELRDRRINLANVLAYNMGVSLADCWEVSGVTLEQRHFEAGLALAERCLAWREQLGKGPHAFSIAHWLKGMHEVSLGRHKQAVGSFTDSLRFAGEHVEAEFGDGVAAHEHFGPALAEGFLGIAEHLGGVGPGAERYAAAITDFTTMSADDSKHDDAIFGRKQLRRVWDRYCRE